MVKKIIKKITKMETKGTIYNVGGRVAKRKTDFALANHFLVFVFAPDFPTFLGFQDSVQTLSLKE